MMKHRHYDMIVTKAANMELTTLVKFGKEWMISAPHTVGEIISFDSRYEYFLCLPQHKEACLHWLKGGESQYLSNGMGEWVNFGASTGWSDTHLFMTTECELRIKPKKEKRWIGVYGNHVTDGMHPTKELCERCVNRSDKFKHCAPEGWQFIEIEVEV